MKFHKKEYSRKIALHDNVELFWNMEYSRKILQQAKLSIFWNMEYSRIFQRTAITTKSATLIFHFFLSIILFLSFYGIWNIPKLCLNKILFQFLEYGIFQKNGNKINIEIGGIWNIRRIFLKNSKTIKISKTWNMEYSIEYSWNIPKKYHNPCGRRV